MWIWATDHRFRLNQFQNLEERIFLDLGAGQTMAAANTGADVAVAAPPADPPPLDLAQAKPKKPLNEVVRDVYESRPGEGKKTIYKCKYCEVDCFNVVTFNVTRGAGHIERCSACGQVEGLREGCKDSGQPAKKKAKTAAELVE